MKALILAAGYATRLRPLTDNVPKALLPIGKTTILDMLVRELATIEEIDGVHIVTNSRFAGQFEAWRAGTDYRFPIAIWDDGTSTNETRLGAIGDMDFVLARAGVDDDLLVAASDNLFTFPLNDFVADFRRHGRDLLLGAHMSDLETLRRFAVATLDGEGVVQALIEKPSEPESDVAIYAIYLYRRDTLPLIRAYAARGENIDAPGCFPQWLHKQKEVRTYLFSGECVDIGTLASYRDACERFGRG